jgi:hypothetical protein
VPAAARVSAELCGEQPPQNGLPAREPHRDGVFRHAEAGRDLTVRRVVDVTLDEGLSCVSRKHSERRVEQLQQLCALEVGIQLELLGRRVLAQHQRVSATAARIAKADVACDRRQPPLRTGRIVKLVRVPPGLEERLLRKILGRGRVAGDHRAQPHEPPSYRRAPQLLRGLVPHTHISPRT